MGRLGGSSLAVTNASRITFHASRIIFFALPIPCKYNGAMSRSREPSTSGNNANNARPQRSIRGLGRKPPRSTLEWAFGGEQERPTPKATNARRNDDGPYQPPRRPPPVAPPNQRPALQGEILPREPLPVTALRSPNAEAMPTYSTGSTPSRPNPTTSTLVALFQGEAGLRRVVATRIALDEALDHWWTNADLAPRPLLRDGLLLLEAGHTLDETQRSFLLRSALRAQRGMITALRHQTDPDRTAFLLKDALLDLHYPLPPQLVPELRREDAQSEEWADYLAHDLAYEATVATGHRSELAAVALAALQGQAVRLPRRADRAAASAVNHPQGLIPLSHRWSLRWLLWLLLTALLLVVYGWGQYRPGAAMVAIAAGTYTISDPARSDPGGVVNQRTVTLAGYAIDRTEVTNRAYRLCLQAGSCRAPTSVASQTRLDYFTNPAYDNFPVVNVDWSAANAYCTWVGKTLPSLEQWEAAAAVAPATHRRFVYPWGDRFEARFANSVVTARQETEAVGTYQPVGNSPWGVTDQAGNVAEWTLMPATNLVDGYVVKGGSFQDDPIALRTDARQEVTKTTAAPWLGFRCAR